MQLELGVRGVPFEAERAIEIDNKGRRLSAKYYADLVCYGQVIVELKAIRRLSGNEQAQVLNYLKATGFRVGVLINFGSQGALEWKRYVRIGWVVRERGSWRSTKGHEFARRKPLLGWG